MKVLHPVLDRRGDLGFETLDSMDLVWKSVASLPRISASRCTVDGTASCITAFPSSCRICVALHPLSTPGLIVRRRETLLPLFISAYPVALKY